MKRLRFIISLKMNYFKCLIQIIHLNSEHAYAILLMFSKFDMRNFASFFIRRTIYIYTHLMCHLTNEHLYKTFFKCYSVSYPINFAYTLNFNLKLNVFIWWEVVKQNKIYFRIRGFFMLFKLPERFHQENYMQLCTCALSYIWNKAF